MDPKMVANGGLLASVLVPLFYTWEVTRFKGYGDLVDWLVSAGLITLGVGGLIGFGIWRWRLAQPAGVNEVRPTS